MRIYDLLIEEDVGILSRMSADDIRKRIEGEESSPETDNAFAYLLEFNDLYEQFYSTGIPPEALAAYMPYKEVFVRQRDAYLNAVAEDGKKKDVTSIENVVVVDRVIFNNFLQEIKRKEMEVGLAAAAGENKDKALSCNLLQFHLEGIKYGIDLDESRLSDNKTILSVKNDNGSIVERSVKITFCDEIIIATNKFGQRALTPHEVEQIQEKISKHVKVEFL